MKKLVMLTAAAVFFSCSAPQLKEPYKSDYRTSGPLGSSCFQVIIISSPDREMKTLVHQRESAYIGAREKIRSETGLQMLRYYIKHSKVIPDSETQRGLKKKFEEYTEYGRIAGEYYRDDNSAVLIYRIMKPGIGDEILSH